MKRVELLAPAGNYESFLGALHAGADAVYLGGAKFGARAYADNFTEEEVCMAIRYAHIYGKKVYLTLNTLIKERELEEICPYLRPFYECGLDGVIIQDFGVFRLIGTYFPGLERHISTQMTVTGKLGAAWLKELGAQRIVPARELSLEEIRQIKESADIEVETFVHGALCYCYSGQCLFSSILGGRSGNRGRCAQPCRLPYTPGKKEEKDKPEYPLSLKDLCTIERLPELIKAGIDSFKIEGRMKSPEYTAGVTAIYRKYIDRCYEAPEKPYMVDRQDMEQLRNLYMRSEISEGYYYRHNAKDMVTLKNPGYTGRDDTIAAQIRETWLEGDFRRPVYGKAKLRTGEKSELTVVCGETAVTAKGEEVQKAVKQPLTEETAAKQLKKSGNTAFRFEKLDIDMSSDAFMPVKALNDLRRAACELLTEALIKANGFAYKERKKIWNIPEENTDHLGNAEMGQEQEMEQGKRRSFHSLVLTWDQYRSAVKGGMERIYISADLCMEKSWKEKAAWQEYGQEAGRQTGRNGEKPPELFLALPYIIRQRDKDYLKHLEKVLETNDFSGVLARNLEEVKWLEEIGYGKQIVSDQNLYIWNREAYTVLKSFCGEHYLPCELTIHEIGELLQSTGRDHFAISVYGRLPMMVTANCVSATYGGCRKQKKETEKMEFVSLTDRYHKTFPVYTNCIHCYNVIYNSLPLSLHQHMEKLEKAGIHTFRLDFTTENGNDVDKILRFFKDGTFDKEASPCREYTNGLLKRGVE